MWPQNGDSFGWYGSPISYLHLLAVIYQLIDYPFPFQVELLVRCGANVAAVTRDGLSSLHCAARSGHEHVVRYLLHDCADAPGGVPGIQCSLKTKNGLTVSFAINKFPVVNNRNNSKRSHSALLPTSLFIWPPRVTMYRVRKLYWTQAVRWTM